MYILVMMYHACHNFYINVAKAGIVQENYVNP